MLICINDANGEGKYLLSQSSTLYFMENLRRRTVDSIPGTIENLVFV